MKNGSWLPEVDFSDDFFDDLVNHIDFPLEDGGSGHAEGDWDAGFQGLEPPPMDMFPSLSSDFNCGAIRKGSETIPILKQSSSSEASPVHGSSLRGVKVSRLFQSSSPVSVLENSNGSFSSQNIRSQRLAFPVKGMRSKRKRPTALKLGLLLPPFEPAKPQQFAPEESESEAVNYASEKKGKKHKIHPTHRGSANSEPRNSEGTVRKCTHCETTKTPQWREGPNGPKTLCNACGVRFRSGRLVPEYRPAASPTFVPSVHSNSHRKIIEMRRKDGQKFECGLTHTVISRA